MDVLATRVLKYRNDHGSERDVTLTLFAPSRTEHDWQCGFQFSPPANQKIVHVYGVDILQAIVGCLKVARGYIEHPTEQRSSWQGMSHSGLPWHAEKPASYHPPDVPPPQEFPADLDVLATRKLGYRDATTGTHSLVLTVYKPLQAKDDVWRCAFGLGSSECTQVRYGRGADMIEALLNALALARAAYEAAAPKDSVASESSDFFDCSDLPYSIGRAYFTDPA
ncbi:MAG: hypothetical protein IPK82_33795 [Polyangiaceae bacterium]|nr:hypothetical protein [Polyangiaceae bacterium]